VTMGYGRRLMGALPPMRRVETKEDWIESLAALTRTSTTAAAST
jgi:ATP-dependent DNA helicase DinG